MSEEAIRERIAALEGELRRLALERTGRVAALRSEIQATNRAFDHTAVRLNREIGKLRDKLPREEPEPERKSPGSGPRGFLSRDAIQKLVNEAREEGYGT